MQNAAEILKSHDKFLIKLGLERIGAVLALLDNPQEKYKTIHVAGTNGKGSTSKIINEMLIKSGYKTGLFTSPHVFSYTERITVNNVPVSDYIFNKLIKDTDELAKKNGIDLSEFELLTAAASYYFYIKGVDYAVLEVGLGGLYDATNIIKKPAAAIITTIDFDHTERLGKTIKEIAAQKAGIIKKGCHVAVNKDNLGYSEIVEAANKNKAKLLEVPEVEIEFKKGKNYAIFGGKKYEFNLLGAHQAKNLALALCVAKHLKIKQGAIKQALQDVVWRYRLEYNKEKNLLIDSAHNPSGIASLRDFANENFKKDKKTLIFGCLKNKDYKKMLDILVQDEDELYFVEFDYPCALKFKELPEKYQSKAKKVKNIDKIINNKKDKSLKILCGSIYMLGQVLKP